uniref:Methyltransferase type 11 n=1 Tax=Solibacter usitatus (strain Ellin6076) TaxID=234267 RepID=Q01YM7_SOLUE
MSAPNRDYALGRTPREYARLALQSQLLRPLTRRVFEDAGIAPGMRVLDLGSGAGDVCMLLSEMVGPSGSVIGVDVDAGIVEHARERVAEAGLSNVTFAHSDLANYRADAPVDALVGRLVLCYLPDPSAPLAALSKSVRPGGIVAFQEPWMMPGMGPESVVKHFASFVFETFRRSGTQVDLGPRLHRVFTNAGLPQPVMRFEALMDGRPDSPLYQYAAETVASLLPKAVEHGVATAGDLDTGTLAARLSAERESLGYAMMSLALVAAWCRTPA